jgi:hypothetical protein
LTAEQDLQTELHLSMSPFDPDMFEPNLFPVEPETFSETLHRREASARKTLRRNADMSEWGEMAQILIQ